MTIASLKTECLRLLIKGLIVPIRLWTLSIAYHKFSQCTVRNKHLFTSLLFISFHCMRLNAIHSPSTPHHSKLFFLILTFDSQQLMR